MNFGIKQLYEKTPKTMVRIGLAFKAVAGSAGTYALNNGSKIAIAVSVLGILGAFLIAFFGESHDNTSNISS